MFFEHGPKLSMKNDPQPMKKIQKLKSDNNYITSFCDNIL